jgi:hypothetical protein
MIEENKNTNWLELIRTLNVPEWLTDNVVTALGKGIYGIITSASEIPVAHIKNRSEKIKLIGEIEREFIKKATQHPLNEIESHPELAKRALENYGIRLIEEQFNKEQLAQKTLEYLKTQELPNHKPEKPLSQDWLTSFWNLASTKSEEEIQNILTKILSNEIINPGTLSLHTLQTLSVLDSKVGNIFAKFCNMSFDDGRAAFFIHPNVFAFQNIGNTEEFGFSFEDLLDLDGANLIRSAESIQLNFSKPDNYVDGKYQYDNLEYASHKAKLDFSGEQLNLIYFTQAGKELRKLIPMEIDKKYTETLQKRLGERLIIEK